MRWDRVALVFGLLTLTAVGICTVLDAMLPGHSVLLNIVCGAAAGWLMGGATGSYVCGHN